jgi:DNA-binding GntR family transcriptional regulator
MYQQINKRLRLLVGREYTFGQQFPTEREINLRSHMTSDRW